MNPIAEAFMGFGIFAYVLAIIGCLACGGAMREEGQDQEDPSKRTTGAWIMIASPAWPAVAVAAVFVLMVDDFRSSRKDRKTSFFKDLFHIK